MTLTPTLVTPERCEYLHSSGLRLIFAMIEPSQSRINAWCEIRWQGNVPAPRKLAFGTYNLMGPRTVPSLVSAAMAGIDPKTERGLTDLKPILHQSLSDAIYDVVKLILNGEPSIDLADVDPHDVLWLLEPLIEVHSNTRLIAPGGIGKSTFALAIAATVVTGSAKILGIRPQVTGPVLYLDWEADPQTHAERLRALCRGHGLNVPRGIHHQYLSGSLSRNMSAVQNAVADTNPVLIVVDSNAMARGASGDGPAEDSTIRLFSALRVFRRPALITDHKSKDAIAKGRRGGYGSQFNENLARVQWEVVRMTDTPGKVELVWRLEKANNTSKGIEIAYRHTFQTENGRLTEARIDWIEPASVLALIEPTGAANTVDRIQAALRQADEAQTVNQIVDATGISRDTIARALNRNKGLFEPAGTGPNKAQLWRVKDQPRDDGTAEELGDAIAGFGKAR
jgi:AAA domain